MTVREQLGRFEVANTTHAGLWLDRYLPQFAKCSDAPKDAARAHINTLITRVQVPGIYRSHYQRWTAHLAERCAQNAARTAEATVDGRMIVGLGTESVLEVGITLHRTYGVPVIPGSALKGLTARHARRLADPAWHLPEHVRAESLDTSKGQSYRALFGDHGEAGCVVFHDALWIPLAATKLPLDLDVMTVHHATYYGAKDNTPPADSDDPNPIPFVTARGSYLIALEGPPAWTDAAMAILKMALSSEGIGAKTAAGYGRLTLDYTSEKLAAAAREKQAEEAAALQAKQTAKAAVEQAKKAEAAEVDRLRRIEQLLRDLEVNNAATLLPQLLALAGATDRHALALRCEAKFTRKKIREAMKNDKSWVKPLVAILYPDDKSTQT